MKLNIDGKVKIIYAGGYAPVGESLINSWDSGAGKAKCHVNEAAVVINKTAEVGAYFGGSYSYGGIGKVTCDVYLSLIHISS